jgi:RNA polymerase sigma factor (sigma-70 family)
MIDHREIAELQRQIAASDDQSAYVRLYRIYFRHLLRFAVSFVRSQPVAEEIVSDVFLQVWKIRRKLDTIHHLGVYLYTAVRNHCLNHLRREKRLEFLLLDEECSLMPSTLANPEQSYLTSELTKAITIAVQDLPLRKAIEPFTGDMGIASVYLLQKK